MEIFEKIRESQAQEADNEADLLLLAKVFEGPQGVEFAALLKRRWLDNPTWIPGESHDWGIWMEGGHSRLRWLLECARKGDELRRAKERIRHE